VPRGCDGFTWNAQRSEAAVVSATSRRAWAYASVGAVPAGKLLGPRIGGHELSPKLRTVGAEGGRVGELRLQVLDLRAAATEGKEPRATETRWAWG